jgi:hypothetical protein
MDNVIAWLAERMIGMLGGLMAFLSATVFTCLDVAARTRESLAASSDPLPTD